MSLTLAGCGGGGSSEAPPTELPVTLQVQAPEGHAPLGTAVTFSSNVDDPRGALSYRWQFGDGASSSAASPAHTYARPGVYAVQLTVTNEAGMSRSADRSLSIADADIVRGKACSGGWCWQRPLPQGNLIQGYFYLDDKLGWAVGDRGTVLATTDGGVTWQAQTSGTELGLVDVFFVDAQIGWITSTHGQLLKTTDGGAHWQAVSTGQTESTATLGATDANNAWVTSPWSDGVLVTRDGGATWTRVRVPDVSVQSYVPVSSTDIWALTYGNTSLRHSTDGGASWAPVALPPVEAGMYRSSSRLQFSDALHGWLIASESGYPVNSQTYVWRTVGLRTVDGGASWQAFAVPDNNSSYTVKFIDADNGFAWSPYGDQARRTSDGGVTWQPLTLPAQIWYMTSFQAHSALTLTVKDSSGRVYLSTDGGAHWSERSASGANAASVSSVWFFGSREGIAIGADGSAIRTSDGGQTWVTTDPLALYGWHRAQFLADGSAGWLISDTGTIYRSTDKGQSWLSPVPQSSATFSASDYHFVDAQQGWAVSYYGYSSAGQIHRSTDGGITWQVVSGTTGYTGLMSIRFADAMHGVAVGPAGVALVSEDGGQTWAPRPTGIAQTLRRLTFIDAQIAVAVGEGGAIVRSTDRGQTWTRVVSGTASGLNDVRFINTTTGWAVGESGTLLVSRDGGLSWSAQPSVTNWALRGVYFTDEQTGWVVGDNGTILATATGGR